MGKKFMSPVPEWDKKDRAFIKQRAQVKSRFYYLFWGIATFAVVAGQLYVGTGYRLMSSSIHRVLDTILVEVEDTFNGERFY